MVDLLSVQEARLQILADFRPGSPVSIRFDESLGRVLATDIVSAVDLPPFANSSMDGFAVIAADVQSASSEHPVRLQTAGDIPAGSQPKGTLRSNQAARIMTGAPLPAGADAVVPIEYVRITDDDDSGTLPKVIWVLQPVKPGQYVRPRGQDVQSGQKVLSAQTRLRPQEIGLLAMLGEVDVPVYPKPRVAIVASGDELLSPDQPLLPAKVRDSNTPMLAALVKQCGGEVVFIGLARDNYESVRQIFDAAVEQDPDLIITSAGVSVGEYDIVRQVIEIEGDLNFWRVNIRPGKPVAFGQYRGKPLLGLPGNPVSAFVVFKVFAQPVLERLGGLELASRSALRVSLAEPVESDGRETYVRARIESRGDQVQAWISGHQGSGNLSSLVQANALLIIPSGVKSLPAGSEVEAWLLDR